MTDCLPVVPGLGTLRGGPWKCRLCASTRAWQCKPKKYISARRDVMDSKVVYFWTFEPKMTL